MQTKFYKLANSNELLCQDISSQLEKIIENEESKSEGLSTHIMGALSSVTTGFVVSEPLKEMIKDILKGILKDETGVVWNLAEIGLLFIFLIAILVATYFVINFLVPLIYKLIEIIKSVKKKSYTEKEVDKKRDKFFRIVENQIIMGLSFAQRTMDLDDEINNSKKNSTKYQENLRKISEISILIRLFTILNGRMKPW